MRRYLLLVPVLLFGCQQANKKSSPANGGPAAAMAPIPFELTSGNVNSDSAVFEQAGITASFANAAGMQTIHISRQGKRLINYMRAVDSNTATIPVPRLILTGTDTVVEINAATRNFFFRIKNNKATYSKTREQAIADSTKKAPAGAGAF